MLVMHERLPIALDDLAISLASDAKIVRGIDPTDDVIASSCSFATSDTCGRDFAPFVALVEGFGEGGRIGFGDCDWGCHSLGGGDGVRLSEEGEDCEDESEVELHCGMNGVCWSWRDGWL
jgi:hypothetical protein